MKALASKAAEMPKMAAYKAQKFQQAKQIQKPQSFSSKRNSQLEAVAKKISNTAGIKTKQAAKLV